jgi:hypothetical protein
MGSLQNAREGERARAGTSSGVALRTCGWLGTPPPCTAPSLQAREQRPDTRPRAPREVRGGALRAPAARQSYAAAVADVVASEAILLAAREVFVLLAVLAFLAWVGYRMLHERRR